MNMDTSTKRFWWMGWTAALLFGAAPFLQGCSEPATEPGETGASEQAADDHGHQHADDADHEHTDQGEHEHADDADHAHAGEGEHEHADGETHSHDGEASPDTVDGLLHAIANTHETIETADTDEKLLDIHHAPYEIRDMLTKLRPMLELSEEDGKQYDELLTGIGQQADLIEQHAHEDEVEMVRAIVEKLNSNIEAIEKIAAPDHVH